MAGAIGLITVFLVLAVLVAVLVWKVYFPALEKKAKTGYPETEMLTDSLTAAETESETQTETETQTQPPVTVSVNPEEIYSRSALLIRSSTGQKVLDKNSTERIYPASMTKIMTAVVILENISDLQVQVRLSEAMFDQLYLAEASMAGFSPGEEVSAIDLLYGVMLPSGAECCQGLAEYISGSEAEFAKLMNQKAVELGMGNTHFVNASGLHNNDHYTTAEDLAKLLEYALENDTFREIATSASYSTQGTNGHPDGITFYNTLFGNMTEEVRASDLIKGGKTGYTEEAGLCLASFAEVNGETYILITAGAQGSHETEQFHILDAYKLYSNITT